MKPIWYIQHKENDYDANTQKIIWTIQEMGMEVHCEKYIPFDGMNYDFLPTNQPVIFIGSIGVIKNGLKQGDKFYPCAWCDWQALSCQTYYSHWGQYLLQQRYGFYPLAEIHRQWHILHELYGNENKIFIRPNANNKEFDGTLVHKDNLAHWWHTANDWQPPPELLCVVARSEVILAEYRLIIADGTVIAGSQYKNEGCLELNHAYPPAIVLFAEEVAKTWSPHPIFCLDIANTATGFRIIECGSVNCAGYYNAELRPIVAAMAKIAEREWDDIFAAID